MEIEEWMLDGNMWDRAKRKHRLNPTTRSPILVQKECRGETKNERGCHVEHEKKLTDDIS